ncbi:uncharacterized protein LOC108093647 [Drosophila ficusphila]|uniref:uncharacterized protein LOC108093647 n=1 Tax=Drosophila ficusphila TaxID=30025 RepID=UPI0007E7E06A|nr:uncharacterized protein LOC108093647 [Drosophila ficusphila]
MRVGGDEAAATTMRAIFSRLAGGTFKMALAGGPRRSPIGLTVHGAPSGPLVTYSGI